MRNRHLTLTALAACSLLATQANARPRVAPAVTAKLPVPQPPVLATTARADLNLPVAARGLTTSTAAPGGSLLVLADGIVAHAHAAQVLPPAPGVQYER